MNFLNFFKKNNNYTNIDMNELNELIKKNKNILILDVRTKPEYNSFNIPRSTNIPLNELNNKINSITKHKDKNVIVYCASGTRSKIACNMLYKNGFNNLYNLKRGL